MKYSNRNQAIRYLQERPWTWLSLQEIMEGTSLPLPKAESLLTLPGNNRFLETRNNEGIVEYRLIGQRASIRRRVVDYLKSKYPEWVNSAQVAKNIGFDVSRVGHILGCEMYRLPVEHRKGHHKRNEYRYVSGDSRSLIDSFRLVKSPKKRNIRTQEMYEIDQKIINWLEHHQCEWFTAAEICSRLNLSITPQSAGTKLFYIARRRSNIHMTKLGHFYSYACMLDCPRKVEA